MRGVTVRASILLSLLGLFSLGCSSSVPLGVTGFCIATSEDDPESERVPFETHVEVRSGLVRVPADQELEEPPAFEACARGMPAWGQFIDEDGVHVWLAAVARIGAREVVRPNVFEAVGTGGRLEAASARGWLVAESLVVSDDDGVVLALHNQVALSEEGLDADGLTVSLAGGTSLANPTPCGLLTERGVRFVTDDGDRTLANGQVEEAIVNDAEFHIANVFSYDTQGSDCTDGGVDRVSASWAAVDASL